MSIWIMQLGVGRSMNIVKDVLGSSWFTRNKWLGSGSVFLLFFLAHSAFSFLSEKIQTRGGVGMDGTAYASMAMDFEALSSWQVSTNFIQRMIPSGLVHYALKFLELPLGKPQIITAFSVLDSVCIAITGTLLLLEMNRLALSVRMRIIGVVAFFFSFAALKWMSYYPVLTDGMAMALGMAMYRAYSTRRSVWLFPLTGIAFFTWPTVALFGFAMIVLPKRDDGAALGAIPVGKREIWLNRGLSVAITVALTGASVWILAKSNWVYSTPEVYQLVDGLLPVSYLVMMGFFFFALLALVTATRPWQLRFQFGRFSWLHVALAVILYLGCVWIRDGVMNAVPARMDFVISMNLTLGVASPGRSLIPHVVYFGPILIFTILRWRSLCALAAKHGLALPVVFGMILLQGLESESRHLTHAFPLVLLMTLEVMNQECPRISALFVVVFCAATLCFSRIWLTIGGEPSTFDINNPKDQLYYMNHGPYVTATPYAIQAAAVILSAVVLYFLWRRMSRNGPAIAV